MFWISVAVIIAFAHGFCLGRIVGETWRGTEYDDDDNPIID